MTDWDNFACPVCNNDDYVPPSGNPSSPVLLIGAFPGEEEIRKGVPMVGATGGVLKAELHKLGLDLNMFRLANLWFHPEPKVNAGKDREAQKFIEAQKQKCLSFFAEQLIKEAKGKKAILLMGAKTVDYFCNKKVSAVCGLQVTSPYLSVPIIYACVNPADVFHSSIGEMRLALTKFAKRLDEEEIL